jgi:hypothetical protein
MKKTFFFYFAILFLFHNIGLSQADGVYYFRLANNNIMEAEGNTFRNNGCKIQIWQRVNNVENQKWQISKTTTGTYKIKNLGSGKFLDVHAPDVNKNGGKVQLWDVAPGNRNQEWIFQNIGSGRYTIRCAATTGNKVLDVTGYAVGTLGTAIQIWDYSTANTSNQIWYLDRVADVAPAASTLKMTRFNPSTHGFKFANTFSFEPSIAGINGPRFNGFCAGMTYAALDYFNTNIPIPNQNFRPQIGTPLYKYIFDRQVHANVSNGDKWAELVVNPFGARTTEFFHWGLQGFNGGRLQELREFIDRGSPVPLGLFLAGNGGAGPHHEVLAIGYDMGRYKGDLGSYQEDFKIFIYDPNYPNQTMTLISQPAASNYCYKEMPSKSWMTYFVDKKCNPSTPPRVSTVSLPNDGLVRILNIEIKTGGDDLRGGSDNVNVTVKYKDGTSDKYDNINLGQRWIGFHCETVPINLRKPAKLNQIHSVVFQTTFGGGIGGDNWDVDGIYITAREGNRERFVFSRDGRPIVRFDGNNRPLESVFVY